MTNRVARLRSAPDEGATVGGTQDHGGATSGVLLAAGPLSTSGIPSGALPCACGGVVSIEGPREAVSVHADGICRPRWTEEMAAHNTTARHRLWRQTKLEPVNFHVPAGPR